MNGSDRIAVVDTGAGRNVVPGRSRLLLRIASMANGCRNLYFFRVRHRWATRDGFVRVPLSLSIWCPNRRAHFGNRVQLGSRCIIQTDVEFGDSVLVASCVSFVGRHDHRADLPGVTLWDSPRGLARGIRVGSDVWIGHGAIILDGVTVGRGSLVAAGAVVTSDVEPYAVVAGAPARPVKMRFSTDEIVRHEENLRAAGVRL